jgi:hypothetical protein
MVLTWTCGHLAEAATGDESDAEGKARYTGQSDNNVTERVCPVKLKPASDSQSKG